MKLENEFFVQAPPEDAWALLIDVPRVIPCMPGAELTEVVDETTFKATMKVKLGPISLSFATDVELAEVDDTYAYKQLQHLDALGLEKLPEDMVNRSGGALGEGHLREANGLARALGCIERLRAGEAGLGLAQSWRGVPSTSAAVAVMRR